MALLSNLSHGHGMTHGKSWLYSLHSDECSKSASNTNTEGN